MPSQQKTAFPCFLRSFKRLGTWRDSWTRAGYFRDLRLFGKASKKAWRQRETFELENALDQWLAHSVTDCPTLEPEKIKLNGQSTEYSASKVHALGKERVQTPRSSTRTGVLREGVWVQVHACLDHDCNSLHRSSFKCVEGGGEVLVQSLLKWVRVFAAEGWA